MSTMEKTVIITGAANGIGRITSQLFAKKGYRVAIADIDVAGGEDCVQAITDNGGKAIFIATDVTQSADMKSLVDRTIEKFATIDVIINNAGITHPIIPIEEIEESLWDKMYAINIKSIYLMAKYAGPYIKKQKGGVIINMASVAGLRPRNGSAAYASSKAAAISLTKELALELAEHNIRVNCICPVVADTRMADQMVPDGADPETFKNKIAATIPLGRILDPYEIAQAALYLASDYASMITGATLSIDGGRSI